MTKQPTNGFRAKELNMQISKELYDESLLVVSWIEKEKPKAMSNDDWQRIVHRNKAHLSMLLNVYEFGKYDRQPLLNAIKD
jgi:hypothetical protein